MPTHLHRDCGDFYWRQIVIPPPTNRTNMTIHGQTAVEHCVIPSIMTQQFMPILLNEVRLI